MSERTVSYRFTGDFKNLGAGLAAMGKGVNDLGVKLTALDKNGAKMRAGLTTVGAAAGKVGLVAAAGLGIAVLAAANFDQAMSKVQAATGETADAMGDLREAAIKAGADTAFSASEAAAGIENLAKAGVSTKDILAGGLSGALDLAAAGELDVATAAEAAATAMTQFKLSGADVPHIADLLAAGAGKAQGEVTDLSAALNQSGLVAGQMGMSIEETTGSLAAFAAAGLLGSDAGTSLKTMLLRLANPSAEAAAAMERFGISAYDAQGNMRPMAEIAEQLKTGFEGQSQATRDAALATIFGSDAIRAANVLYSEGADGITGWTDKVDDAGYAAETAATKLDNLKGDLEAFMGSLETALIGAGESSQGPLRKLVQGSTELVNALGAIPGPAKTAATGLLGVTAVMGASLWAGAKVISGIASMKAALRALGIEAVSTRQKLALVGTGGAAAALGIGTFIDTISLMDSLSRSRDAADATVKSYQDLADALSFSNVGKNADDLHINLDRLTEDLIQNGAEGEYASQVLDDLAESSHGLGAAANSLAGNILPFWTANADKAYDANKDLNAIIGNLGTALAALPDSIPDDSIWAAFYGAADAADDATGATLGYVGAAYRSAAATDEEAAALRDGVKAMREKVSATLAAFDAETQYRQALKAARAQGDKNNAGIKGSSDAAIENRGVISSLAAAWNNQSAAVKNNGERFRQARSDFIETAVAMGVPKRAAKELADQILDIPQKRAIKITADTAAAKAAAADLKRRIDEATRDRVVTIRINRLGDAGIGPTRINDGADHGADGATVPKTGLPYADRHHYLLADGEEVISNRYGQADRYRAEKGIPAARRLADGGTAGLSTYARTRSSNGDALVPELTAFNDTLALSGVFLRNELKARQKLLTKEVEANKTRLDAIKAEASALKESVANRFQSDIWAKSEQIQLTKPEGFADWDPAKQREFLEAEAKINASMQQSPNDILRADIAAAKKLMADLAKLRKRGLDGAALASVATNADPGQIAALLSGSNAQLAEFEQLYGTRQQVSQQAGQSAVNLTGLTSEMRAARAEFRESNTELKRLNHRMERMEKLAEKAPKETGDAVGDAVNSAAGNGHRNRRRKP